MGNCKEVVFDDPKVASDWKFHQPKKLHHELSKTLHFLHTIAGGPSKPAAVWWCQAVKLAIKFSPCSGGIDRRL